MIGRNREEVRKGERKREGEEEMESGRKRGRNNEKEREKGRGREKEKIRESSICWLTPQIPTRVTAWPC